MMRGQPPLIVAAAVLQIAVFFLLAPASILPVHRPLLVLLTAILILLMQRHLGPVFPGMNPDHLLMGIRHCCQLCFSAGREEVATA